MTTPKPLTSKPGVAICCSCEKPLPPNAVMLDDGRYRCVACQVKVERQRSSERMVQERRHPYG